MHEYKKAAAEATTAHLLNGHIRSIIPLLIAMEMINKQTATFYL